MYMNVDKLAVLIEELLEGIVED